MTEASMPPESQETPEGPSGTPLPEAEIRAELQRILASREFKSSKRCLQFLEYVVEQTLAGLPNGLKERTIGVEVFDRAVTYDTNVEGIVRIKASEVRKRLTLYYAGTGKDSTLRIELPVGTYIPVFSRLEPKPETSGPQPIVQELPQTPILPPQDSDDPGPARRWNRWIWPGAAALLLLALGLWRPWSRSPFEDFWAPVLSQKRPVLVAAAYAPVYLSTQVDVPQSLSQMTLLKDQFVGGGDLVAAAQITGMLARLKKTYDVRVGQGATFEDLRGGPSVLIGYSSTHWKEMTRDFRYYIDDTHQTMVCDRGKATDWIPNLSPELHTDLDYAIVSRALLPQTNAPMILITGCTQYGTEAAGILVTHPELLAEALKDAPKGWQHMNLELVLEVKVIANSPANPRVIASHYW